MVTVCVLGISVMRGNDAFSFVWPEITNPHVHVHIW